LGRCALHGFGEIGRAAAAALLKRAGIVGRRGLTGDAGRLLDDMGKLVRDEPASVAAVRREPARRESDVLSERVRRGMDGVRGAFGCGMPVHANGGKIVPEPRLEIGAQIARQGLAVCADRGRGIARGLVVDMRMRAATWAFALYLLFLARGAFALRR